MEGAQPNTYRHTAGGSSMPTGSTPKNSTWINN